MTEKRYNYVAGEGFHFYGAFLSPYVVEALLNDLSDENEQLKKLNEKSNNTRALLKDELRGLFHGYMVQCRSISEEAIITLIKRDVKKIVFEVFEE